MPVSVIETTQATRRINIIPSPSAISDIKAPQNYPYSEIFVQFDKISLEKQNVSNIYINFELFC